MEDMLHKYDFLESAGVESYRGQDEAEKILFKFGGIRGLIEHVCIKNGLVEVSDEPMWGDVVVFEADDEFNFLSRQQEIL